MSVFIQPPFWALPYGRDLAPHAVAVRVTPAVAIASSSIASPTVITTTSPHGLVSGDTGAIAGHTGLTPAVDGSRVVTVIDSLHLSVPVAVTVAGAGGTITRELAAEPLTLAEAKLYARLSTTDASLDAILPEILASMRAKVQQDTGIVLLTETYDVFFDALPRDRTPIPLPWRPVASITSVKSVDSSGVVQTLAGANYELDPASEAPLAARVALSTTGTWPTDLRPFQPYVLRLIAGYASVASIPAPLVHAVGLLIDAYVNRGTLDAYEDAIAPYRLVTVA